ncbi:hypothetical protein RND81_03G049700 [Saponaria officinalis]|uniref:ATP-dependent DNA helicase n=1 Tax=Saponaria officinalis TaxID=3572 RepID=A0AAW1M5M1_SAPOF
MATALEVPPLQGIATSALRIIIPFHPLLRQITKLLKFPEPECQLLDEAQNNMCIAVKTDIGPIAYVYVGGEAETLGQSFERASQIAVRDLVKKYSIIVEDVTYNKTLAVKKCADLYRLKRAELERKKKHRCRKGKGRAISRLGGIMRSVSVDYMSVVRGIFRKIEIRSTPIETVQIWPNQFVTWLAITPVEKLTTEECLISEPCPDTETAEQNLAKKIISYVSPLYNIEIIDVNHGSQETAYSSVLCAHERESYLTVRERVLGIRELTELMPLLVEQGCVTPRESVHRIPDMECPPPPPKKRKCTAGCCSKHTRSDARNYFKVPDNWDANWVSSAKVEGMRTAKTGQQLPRQLHKLSKPKNCAECGALKFEYESMHFCCGEGQIKLSANEYPPELVRLYTSREEYAVHFQKYARLYNNLFAFTSIRGRIDAKTQKGIYVFKLHGQMYHNLPELIPNDAHPKYLQLYFYDGQHEAENRLRCFPELHQNVIEELIKISQTNPYAKFFRSLREIQVQENTQIVINRNPVLDQSVYNAPTSDEVVVIWSEDTSSSSLSGPHILVTGKSNESHRIMHYYGCYDPLQYPILFPRGECGWRQGLPRVGKDHMQIGMSCPGRMSLDNVQDAEGLLDQEARLSCREYYCYKLQNRPNNYMLRAGRCLQQYVVDMYVKVENTRLDFLRKNQKTIRAELYQGILDTLETGENCAANIGRRVILPPTFLGGPRDIKKRYLNAMSLVQKYGKPDLFITMTCNSSWPEIKEQLSVGEEAQNRPDLVSRIFGEVAALVYVVEFQKRGLPHAHFLIILKPEFRLKCPEDYDKFISAEIPPEGEAHLRKSVLRHMMHGPCGPLNTECPCMKHPSSIGRCKYGFPKQMRDTTTNNAEGYPIYRRHDKIAFNVLQNNIATTVDEIEQYQSGCWVSFCEAAWRIFGFDLFEMHPPVMPLPIHLPNMQSVQIRPHEKLDQIVSSESRTRTPLTEFFRTNEINGGDLMTVDGYRCKTFQEAALKHRLLEEDDAVEMCLKEAFEVQMPFAVRRLFATLLVFFQPSNPLQLWTDYYNHLSEDFTKKNPNNPMKARSLTVKSVEQYLEAMGKTLKCFGLDHLAGTVDDAFRRTKDITDALDAPIPQECVLCRGLLNPAQQEAFDRIIQHVRDKIPGVFFVDGPGGTGKTFLYNALYADVRLMGKIVLPTATSGIAASNIPSGRTAHSRFKIPIDLETSLSCDVPKQGGLAALIREADLLIWDEASMARKENIESLDVLLRDLCNPKFPFGGKVIVFGGDFRQILPVVPHKSLKEAVSASLVASQLWPNMIRFRLSTDSEHSNPLAEITSMLFEELGTGNCSSEAFTTQAILTPMNEDVDALNSILIEKFPRKAIHYKIFDMMLDDSCNIYPSEFNNKLCPGGVSPHDLVLKENCPVILLRNILPSFGLCNGTRLVCSRFFPNLIDCIIVISHHKGEHAFIPRVKLRPSTSNGYPFQFQRKQFPIKLSFAMTINKSQGQTLNKVAIYLRQPCFSPGQLYVALSRARKSTQVSVFATKHKNRLPITYLKNVVSYDVLKLAGIL